MNAVLGHWQENNVSQYYTFYGAKRGVVIFFLGTSRMGVELVMLSAASNGANQQSIHPPYQRARFTEGLRAW